MAKGHISLSRLHTIYKSKKLYIHKDLEVHHISHTNKSGETTLTFLGAQALGSNNFLPIPDIKFVMFLF
jgi:hypothetical protein